MDSTSTIPRESQTSPKVRPMATTRAEYRVAVFAVPADEEAFLQVLQDRLGMNGIDARIHLHELPGLLPDRLEQPVAIELAAAIRELGVEAQAVATADLPVLEHVASAHHVRCGESGLELIGTSGGVDETIPWSQLKLVSIADVPLESVRHYVARPTAVIRAGPGRVSPPSLDKPPVRGAEMWIICEGPFRAIRIDHREMNYEYLGDRKSSSAAANFSLFVADLAVWAPQLYWTPAARAFRRRAPAAEYRFDSRQAHRDATMLQVLLMRRMRDAGAAVATDEPRAGKELAMIPERSTLISSGPLQEAHEALRQTVEELRGWWQEVEQLGKPRFGEMGTRVESLRSIVAEHFQLEEAGGYLKEPLNAAPHLAEQAQRLKSDHAAVLSELEHLAQRLEASPCEVDCWTAAWHELAAILARLEQHEHEENEFWQVALENDFGVID